MYCSDASICKLQLAFLKEANTSKTTTKIWNDLGLKFGRDGIKTLFPILLTGNGSDFSDPEAISELTQEKVNLMMNHINSYPRHQYKGKTHMRCLCFTMK